MIWSDLLVPGVPVLEKAIRPLIVYVALLLLLRMFGKRELAQLNQFDLVVLLMLSNTVQNAIIGNDNSVTGGLIGAVDPDGRQLPRRPLSLSPRADRPRRRRQGDDADREGARPERQSGRGADHRGGAGSGRAPSGVRDAGTGRTRDPRAGGNLAFYGFKPTETSMRQHELVAHLEEIKALIRARA